MILLIDNYDSFTYNLYQQIAGLGYPVLVVKHDALESAQVIAMQPTHIVISPGPKGPKDSGKSREIIRQFYKTTPILGVCLGHQCIGEVFGSRTVQAPGIMHGKTDLIYHQQNELFSGIPNPFAAARYHSLVVDKLPREFIRTAWSGDDSLMAMRHSKYPVFGVQFHPESFMTEYGNKIMDNFLKCSAL